MSARYADTRRTTDQRSTAGPNAKWSISTSNKKQHCCLVFPAYRASGITRREPNRNPSGYGIDNALEMVPMLAFSEGVSHAGVECSIFIYRVAA